MTAAGRFIRGDFYRIFVIDLPAKGPNGPIGARGDWQLRMTGKPGTPYEAAAIVDTERTSYDGAFEGRRPRVGDLVALTVRVAADKRPIEGPVRVTATLLTPGVAVGNVIAERPAIDPDKLDGADPARRQPSARCSPSRKALDNGLRSRRQAPASNSHPTARAASSPPFGRSAQASTLPSWRSPEAIPRSGHSRGR